LAAEPGEMSMDTASLVVLAVATVAAGLFHAYGCLV
jgi:hypothetical protein